MKLPLFEKRTILLSILVIMGILILKSCSLLKFSADLGMEPLSKNDLNSRVAVRSFANNFNEIVAVSADTIASLCKQNPNINQSLKDSIILNSIRWKKGATGAVVYTSLSSVPIGAIVNTWVLVKGMNKMDWENILNKYAYVPQTSSEFLLNRYEGIIKPFLAEEKMNLMRQFVDSVVAKNPVDMKFAVKDYTYDWMKYSGMPDTTFIQTVGSISEVIADMGDGILKYSMNVSDQINWSGDQFKYQVSTALQDSTVKVAIDSLNHTIDFFKVSLKEAPDKVDSLVNDINKRVERILYTLDANLKATLQVAFDDFSKERIEISHYISKEREIIMNDGKVLLDDTVAKLLEGVSSMIRNLLIYIILFVFLIVGLPFYIGYRIGKRKTTKEP